MPDKTLTKDQLSQLDSNIRKMVADGLGENDINAYARDFKEKFGTPSKPEPILRQGYAPTKGLPSFEEQQEVLQQVNRFSDSINKDKKKTGSYMGAIFDSFVSAVDPINYIADDVVMKSYEYLSGKKMTPEAKAIARVGTEAIRQTAPLAGLPKTQEKEYVSELQSGWDMSEGFGTKDLKALGVMGSRVLGDLALAASAQAVGVPIGSTYFIQGYGSGLEDYDNMVVNRKVNEDQKTRQFYGLTLGVVNGLLEKFAFDKIFGSGPAYNSIKNKIVSNIFKETAKSTGKLTVDAVENTAKDLVRKELSSIGKRGVRALYGAGVEAVTESSQTALEEATKLISNKIQGEEVFDEKEIKDKFLMNLLNSFVGGFALGGPMGVTSTFMNDVNLKVIDEIAKANTDQQLNSVIADLEQAMVDSKASDEEIELMKNNVVRYNNIKRSIPENVRPEAKSKIIELIDRREGLDAKVGEWKNQLEQVDESMKPDVENELNNLVDARDMINDEIRENAAGGKFSYTEQDGKYFKSFNNESPVEITKSRYELQKTKENATTESKEPVQEGPATGGVSEYQGAEEVQPTKTPIEEAAPKADTGDSVVSGTQEEVIQKTKQSELDVVRERINKINAARDRGELLEDSYPGELKELKKKEKKLSKLDTGEKGIVSEGTVKEFPPEIQDIITEEKQIIDNILNMYSDDAGVVDIYKRMLSRLEENPQEYFKNELSRYSNVTELDGSLSLPQQVSRYKNIVEQFNRRTLPIEQRAEARPTARPSTITPVITTKPKIGRVTSGNVDTVTDLGTNKIQKKVLNDVKRVFNALKSFIPETVGRYTTINLHDQESFKNAVIEAGGKEQDSSSRGFYMASDGSIHLNMDNLASDTMLHEGFHPILDFIEQTNPEKINEFFGQLEAIPEASEIISQARQNYDGDVTQKKEAITDFVAGVADGRIVLNPTNFQKIKAFIQNLLNNIGIGQEQVLMNVKNQSDLVKLAKFVTEKFDTGSEIKADEIGSLIFGDRKYDSSDGVDVNEELPTTGDNRGPQFSKDTIEAAKENLKSPEQLAGTKISRVVFYDLTRVGKLSIKNIKTGYTPDIDGKGGPFYSYMKNSIANKAVLAFTSINQAIQSLQRQIRFPDGVHAVASQNPQTAHLGNKSTLAALFGDGIGIFQDAAKNKAQETEIVNVLKSEIDRISKMPGGEAAKAVKKILKKVDLKSIKTINDFRDKILLGEGDSFGSRGSIFAEILQGKQTKITAATRQSHKILHYKYGIPTIADIAQGNNQQELSSAELGDVIKLVKPSTEPVIYTNDKTLFDKYTANPTPQMKKSGIRIELIPEEAGHESYPFVLAGENVALLDNFISAAKLFKRFENLPKKKSFFSVGRMKKEAEAGAITESVIMEVGRPEFQKVAQIGVEKQSGTTQVATTVGSYKKASQIASKLGAKTVLDYGAGLGLGTDAISESIPSVESFEPNAERWQGKNPVTYTNTSDIDKKYDAVINLNVLNVVPKDIRDAIVLDIFDKLNVGGNAIISTRKWSGDVNGAKNATPGPEPKSLIIKRKSGGKEVDVYQKGFDGNELVDYINNILGDAASITKDNSFGASGVIIKKNYDISEPQFQKVPKKAISQKPIVGVIKKNFKDAFNSFGLLGKDVKILQEKMSGELSAEMIKAERLAKKSMSLVKKYEKSVPISVVEDFMTGKTPASNLPSDLANAINEARAHIDILTDRLIQLGAIPQESIDNYKNNRGKYLLRSYESINFTDSKLAKFLYGEGLNVDNVYKKLKNVDKSVVDAAIKYLADRARKNNAKLTEEEAIEIAKKDVNEILSDSESYVMQKGLTGSVNVNSLSQRKDIAPEIRALMGEYTDPIYNYYSTIYKIAGLTSSRAYLNDLRTAGLGNFLFEKNDPNRPKEASEVIAAKYTETLAPLNNLYTFPELAEALKKSEKQTTDILQQMAGRIRAFKTVYNPATHVKNVIGNMGFAVSNGHWNYAPETFGYIKQMISGKKTKELLNLMDILNRNGVLNSSVGLGEIKSYFDRHADLQSFQKYIYNNATKQTSLYKKGKKISGNLAKIPRAIEKAYGLEDDMFKILGFVNESNRYAKIIYKKNYFDLTAKEKADIDEISSEIVKDTYPTFSRVPKIVRGLSKVLFIGNFLSFPAESVRVSYNTLKLAMKEIKSGNKEMARVGMTRLIGTGIYNSLFSTLVYSGYHLAGAGLTGLLGFFSDEEEEKKNKDAINKFLAPWNKKSDIYVGKFSDGKLIYWDIGSLDSYNYQKQVWNAFWNNINNDKGFVESISKAIATGLDPWIEMDFVYDNMIKIINNNDDYGNKIYNPEKGYASKTIDIGKFATKQFAPGAIGAAIKMYEYYDRGDADKLKNEINSQFGARMYTVDLKKSFQSYIYTEPGNAVSREVGFKKRLDDARSIYTDAKRKGVDGAELDAEYARAIEAYKSVLMDTRSYYEAAIRGGVNAYELNMMLNKARLGDRRRDVELLSVMLNKYDYPDMYYIQK